MSDRIELTDAVSAICGRCSEDIDPRYPHKDLYECGMALNAYRRGFNEAVKLAGAAIDRGLGKGGT